MQTRDEVPRDRGSTQILAIRLAAASYAVLGVGFGSGAVWAVAQLQRRGELPMTPFGFRALSGPFERLGTGWFSALGLALAGVGALHVLAGAWLWQGKRRGLELGAATTIPALVLGAGFALPLLIVGLPVSLLLALAGRRTLRA
ncbi:MAG: hypothetical protein ACHQ02_03425 [Candidatus Limnocylindrales bacterium]|jgi:hypothetical protein